MAMTRCGAHRHRESMTTSAEGTLLIFEAGEWKQKRVIYDCFIPLILLSNDEPSKYAITSYGYNDDFPFPNQLPMCYVSSLMIVHLPQLI